MGVELKTEVSFALGLEKMLLGLHITLYHDISFLVSYRCGCRAAHNLMGIEWVMAGPEVRPKCTVCVSCH